MKLNNEPDKMCVMEFNKKTIYSKRTCGINPFLNIPLIAIKTSKKNIIKNYLYHRLQKISSNFFIKKKLVLYYDAVCLKIENLLPVTVYFFSSNFNGFSTVLGKKMLFSFVAFLYKILKIRPIKIPFLYHWKDSDFGCLKSIIRYTVLCCTTYLISFNNTILKEVFRHINHFKVMTKNLPENSQDFVILNFIYALQRAALFMKKQEYFSLQFGFGFTKELHFPRVLNLR